jgi:hypothetical protein
MTVRMAGVARSAGLPHGWHGQTWLHILSMASLLFRAAKQTAESAFPPPPRAGASCRRRIAAAERQAIEPVVLMSAQHIASCLLPLRGLSTSFRTRQPLASRWEPCSCIVSGAASHSATVIRHRAPSSGAAACCPLSHTSLIAWSVAKVPVFQLKAGAAE